MTRRQHKPAADQLLLPYGKPSDLAIAIRSIDYRATPMSEHCWGQARETLIALAYCGGGKPEGSKAPTKELLRIADDDEKRSNGCEPIGSQRTLERRLTDLVKLGLVVVQRRYKRSAIRRLDLDRIGELRGATVRLKQREREAQKRAASRADASGETTGGLVSDHCRIGGETTGGSVTNLTSLNPSVASMNSTNWSTSKKRDDQEIDWGQARTLALIAVRKVGATSERRDKELVVKAAALVQRGYSEAWLMSAANGVAVKRQEGRLKRPWGYFWNCLLNSASESGKTTMRRDLAQLEPPEWVFAAPSDGDLSRRLCAAEVDT